MKGKIDDWKGRIVYRKGVDPRYRWRITRVEEASGAGRGKIIHLDPVCDSWKPTLVLPSVKVRETFYEQGEEEQNDATQTT